MYKMYITYLYLYTHIFSHVLPSRPDRPLMKVACHFLWLPFTQRCGLQGAKHWWGAWAPIQLVQRSKFQLLKCWKHFCSTFFVRDRTLELILYNIAIYCNTGMLGAFDQNPVKNLIPIAICISCCAKMGTEKRLRMESMVLQSVGCWAKLFVVCAAYIPVFMNVPWTSCDVHIISVAQSFAFYKINYVWAILLFIFFEFQTHFQNAFQAHSKKCKCIPCAFQKAQVHCLGCIQSAF